MSKPTVLFLHGFQSGTASSKWRYLLDKSELLNPVIMPVDYETTDPYSVCERLVRFVGMHDDPIIVAHSLGAFFARLVTSHEYRTVLVNPSLTPTQTLFKYPERRLPESFKGYYEHLERQLPMPLAAEIVLIEQGDTVVDHVRNRHLYDRSKVYEIEGGDHSFLSLNMIEQAILELKNRPWQ